MPSDSLVALVPAETLTFRLRKNSECRENLKITNTSKFKIAFKVKTTQPSWYYVRPNQQVLEPGQTENVVIVLVEAEGVQLLDLSENERKEKFEKHRFLVQTKIIEDTEFDRIILASSTDRGDEFAKLWLSGPKDDKKNIKLKVDFILDQHKANPLENFENSEAIRNKVSGSDPSYNESGGNEAVISELLALRKKYDSVVEYTVHLTAERDTVVAQLDEVQKELNREKQKKKLDTKILSKAAESNNLQQGIVPFIFILLVATLSFVIGKYLHV